MQARAMQNFTSVRAGIVAKVERMQSLRSTRAQANRPDTHADVETDRGATEQNGRGENVELVTDEAEPFKLLLVVEEARNHPRDDLIGKSRL